MKVLIPLLGQGRQYCLTLHFYTLYLFILMACAILAAMHFEVCSQGIVCWSHVCLKSNVLRCVLVLCGKYDFGVLFFYAVVMVNGHVFLSIHWSICLWAPSALPPLRASCLKEEYVYKEMKVKQKFWTPRPTVTDHILGAAQLSWFTIPTHWPHLV